MGVARPPGREPEGGGTILVIPFTDGLTEAKGRQGLRIPIHSFNIPEHPATYSNKQDTEAAVPTGSAGLGSHDILPFRQKDTIWRLWCYTTGQEHSGFSQKPRNPSSSTSLFPSPPPYPVAAVNSTWHPAASSSPTCTVLAQPGPHHLAPSHAPAHGRSHRCNPSSDSPFSMPENQRESLNVQIRCYHHNSA